MVVLERLQLVEEAVVVRELRIVEDVVPVELVVELLAELRGPPLEVGSRLRRHGADRIGGIPRRRVEDVASAGGLPLPPPVEAPAAGCRLVGASYFSDMTSV